MRIKPKPEKFQESKNTYDLILTCEEKVYDQVMESFESAGSTSAHLAHIINIDVIDNPEDATLGAFVMLKLVQKLDSCEDLDDEIDEILQEFESTTNRAFLHTVAFECIFLLLRLGTRVKIFNSHPALYRADNITRLVWEASQAPRLKER